MKTQKPAALDKLTMEDIVALRAVSSGADVYDRGIAMILRDLAKRGFVSIEKAVDPPSVEKRQPYFGAITTKAGRAAIVKATEGR